MRLVNKKIGFAVTGSHCTLEKILSEVKRLVEEGAEVTPILSENVQQTDTRFGEARLWTEKLVEITKKEPITSITEAEPIGPKGLLDVVLIAPCTGNTLAKLANGITDGTVLMAAKAHLRNQRPVVLAVSTNDGLGFNAKNIGLLLNSKNIYFVPFGQDDPVKKPGSLVAKMDKILDTVEGALAGKQIQPLLYGWEKS
ncbi:dipicolinate synthase subunit B [Zhaonella formicivorans]|jgi:dipicolinate synthase subunit B|uniref:dipicolinate synthase subunit B n=1 Tax=Zhaonella formicivorans TaxID=2528593 RepID=UPI0010D9F2A6|nr:dipicolinate synthase subunit B [Zhaonella formicivorans]